jgi:hypothetical protein
MNPIKTLPETYTLAWAVDMKKDHRLNWVLQFAAAGWSIIATLVLWWIVSLLRPNFAFEFSFDSASILVMPLWALLIIFCTIVLHELVHGFFFWFFTREMPRFGIKLGYAYAAAPDWYFPKGKYMVIGLSPLIVLTVLGLIAIVLVPVTWVTIFFLAIVFNAGGAVGDLYICTRIGGEAQNIWVKDKGDEFEVYRSMGVAVQ